MSEIVKQPETVPQQAATVQTTIMNADEVDVACLRVSKPLRDLDQLFAKVRSANDKSKIHMVFSQVGVIRRMLIDDPMFPKSTSILELRVSRAVRRKMAEIDEYIVSQVQNNKTRWFTRKMDSCVVDELYKRMIVPASSSSGGDVLRMRLVQSPEELEKMMALHLDSGELKTVVLFFSGLRFMKHSFCLEWQMASIANAPRPDLIREDDEDDDGILAAISSDSGAGGESDPTHDDLTEIIEDLMKRCVDLRAHYHRIRIKATENWEKLDALVQGTLATSRRLADIDDAAEEILRIESESCLTLRQLNCGAGGSGASL